MPGASRAQGAEEGERILAAKVPNDHAQRADMADQPVIVLAPHGVYREEPDAARAPGASIVGNAIMLRGTPWRRNARGLLRLTGLPSRPITPPPQKPRALAPG